MPKRLTVKKKYKNSKYIGVVKKDNQWYTTIAHNRVKNVFGPFETEIMAAEIYDEKALEFSDGKRLMNFIQSQVITANHTKIKKKEKSKKQKIYKRKQFSTVTRNKICAKQKWCCNCCKKLFDDIYIVDHIVPLFLGGSNEEHNLQSLCPSCDRFKTSLLDRQVLKPIMNEKGKLTIEDVFQAQKDNYPKMMCVDPLNINCQQYIANSNINCDINNKSEQKDITLLINGVEIKIHI